MTGRMQDGNLHDMTHPLVGTRVRVHVRPKRANDRQAVESVILFRIFDFWLWSVLFLDDDQEFKHVLFLITGIYNLYISRGKRQQE